MFDADSQRKKPLDRHQKEGPPGGASSKAAIIHRPVMKRRDFYSLRGREGDHCCPSAHGTGQH